MSYEVVRVTHEGKLYHQVVASDGQELGPAQLQALAESPCEHLGIRKLQFIVADESLLRTERRGLKLKDLLINRPELSLIFLDTNLEIGDITHSMLFPPRVIRGTQGHVLVMVASLYETVLADVAWRALLQRLLGGVCAGLGEEQWDAEGRVVSAVLQSIILGDLERSCLPSGRVLAAWEEDKEDLVSSCPYLIG